MEKESKRDKTMGLDSSQVRLLGLTTESHNIQLQKNKLARQKTDLTRETQKISKEYTDALNSKVLKWSSNAGVTYSDITYSSLMRPGATNNYSPYLITDSRNRVVLDSKYAEYANFIEANGGYDACRYEALEMATGIDAATIAEAEQSELETKTLQGKYEATQAAAQEALAEARTTESPSYWATDILQAAVAAVKTSDGKTTVSATNAQSELINEISYGEVKPSGKNVNPFAMALITELVKIFPESEDEIEEKVKTALNDPSNGVWKQLSDWAQSVTSASTGSSLSGFTYDKNANTISFTNAAELMESFLTNMGLSTGDGKFYYYNFGNNGHITKEDYLALLDEIEESKAAYYAKQSSTNEILTAEQERMIRFYDSLFMAISEKGWTQNDQVSDTDYLNQMLQNNLYTITTIDYSSELPTEGVKTELVCPSTSYVQTYTNYDNGQIVHSNNYKTSIASNMDTVFAVNDDSVTEKALAEYEAAKSRIKEKEDRIDYRLNILNTRDTAIQQMIKNVEQIKNDNTSKTFSIFSASA